MFFLLCGRNVSWCSLKCWGLKISFQTDEGSLCLNLFKMKWASLGPNSWHCQRTSTAQKPERRIAQKPMRNPSCCAIRWYQCYALPERHGPGKATSMTALAQHCSSPSLWCTYPDKSLQLLNLFLRLGYKWNTEILVLLAWPCAWFETSASPRVRQCANSLICLVFPLAWPQVAALIHGVSLLTLPAITCQECQLFSLFRGMNMGEINDCL